jgi:aryl-alcohol dehydrogenase-like predicted oxidoreductase
MALEERRVAIGTAQFGMRYGVANQTGQVTLEEARQILNRAHAAGVDTVDTCVTYGDSELRLGELGVGAWRVVSKVPAMDAGVDADAFVSRTVHGSLQRLRIPKLAGVLLRRPQDLLGSHGKAIQRALIALKRESAVAKVGVSIYGPDELDMLWPHFQPDIVQAPFNILDRRLSSSGWLTRLRDAGVEIHTRSVFLQGLLLMESASRPERFQQWSAVWQRWHAWLQEASLTPVEACIRFALSHPEIDRIVVGVDSLSQLKEILAAVHVRVTEFPRGLLSTDQNLINPTCWNAN